MSELEQLLAIMQVDSATLEDACIRHCGRSKECKYYQFEREKCPKIKELKKGFLRACLFD